MTRDRDTLTEFVLEMRAERLSLEADGVLLGQKCPHLCRNEPENTCGNSPDSFPVFRNGRSGKSRSGEDPTDGAQIKRMQRRAEGAKAPTVRGGFDRPHPIPFRPACPQRPRGSSERCYLEPRSICTTPGIFGLPLGISVFSPWLSLQPVSLQVEIERS
jgi:hypothetical protein